MNLLDRLFLPVLFVVTVAASAATVLTLDRYGIIAVAPQSSDRSAATPSTSNVAMRDDRKAATPETANFPVPPLVDIEDALRAEEQARVHLRPQQHDDEIAFVPPHVVALMPSDMRDETNDETNDEEAATADSSWSLDAWTTETHRDVAPPAPRAGPLLTVKTAIQLPWRSPAPAQTVSLQERLAQISPTAKKRLVTKFLAANAAWPPADIGLVAIKDQKVIELHARQEGGPWKLVHQYPVKAASGGAGPKLRKGDKQVPEGVYGISFLNPNSRYHVSMRVNYPNAFDRRMAAKDGRKELGGDIMIHGKAASVGCLAIGDEAAEELFVLTELAGLPNVKLVIAPTDFRRYGVPAAEEGKPGWLPELYTEVASAMSEFKAPPSVGLLSFFGN